MTPPATGEILEHGAQAERTRLAWNRTALALAINAALLIHLGGGSPWRHGPAIAMLLVSVGCFLFAQRRYRQINAAVRAGRPVMAIAQLRLWAYATVIPAVIALVAIASS